MLKSREIEPMTISEAQRDVRSVFLGGFAGQLVSSCIWFASSGLATWYSIKAGIIALVVGGFFIFPLTQGLLRAMGRPFSLPKGHPMNALAVQIAFTVGSNIPLAFLATMHRLTWFYPAFMIIVGSHYLPFIFLYGMPRFAVRRDLDLCRATNRHLLAFELRLGRLADSGDVVGVRVPRTKISPERKELISRL